MKRFFEALAWKLKWNWQCVGGHYIDKDGRYAVETSDIRAYRYVWCNNDTHKIRTEDKPQKRK